jgi:hypothetical protein
LLAMPLLLRSINAEFDYSSPQIFRVNVLEKSISHGKQDHHYLLVGAWEPRTHPQNVAVSRDVYDSINVGQKVCVSLHSGAINLPWYLVQSCY